MIINTRSFFVGHTFLLLCVRLNLHIADIQSTSNHVTGHQTMFFSVIIFIVVAKTFYCKSDSDYPSCGSCWCIPSDSGLGPCPLWQPQSNFSSAVIETYQKQIPSWIYRLNCNPYDDASCTTTPRQTMLDSEEAVCGYVYPVTSANPLEVSCTDYTMITFASRVEAERNKAVVTHEGSCGLCSTAQDLAVYLSKLLTCCWLYCVVSSLCQL